MFRIYYSDNECNYNDDLEFRHESIKWSWN